MQERRAGLHGLEAVWVQDGADVWCVYAAVRPLRRVHWEVCKRQRWACQARVLGGVGWD
jgi:hypothetical protein